MKQIGITIAYLWEKRFRTIMALAIVCLLSACRSQHPLVHANMYQVATLQSLMQGHYDTVITVAKLKEKGDCGIGTFENCNGEMIMIDGQIYQALNTGEVKVATEDTGVPFASVAFFNSSFSETVSSITNLTKLKEKLNAAIQEHKNSICIVKITGSFSNLAYRSENPLPKGDRTPLAKWIVDNQIVWEKATASGVIIGVYFPNYCDGLNTAGWHLHFLSKDASFGGHLLEISIDHANVSYSYTEGYEILLPDTKAFHALDLTLDQKAAITTVENSSLR